MRTLRARLRPARKPSKKAVVLVVLGMLAALSLAALGVRLVRARNHLLAGQRAIEAAQRSLDPAGITDGQALARLEQARARFRAGRDHLASPLLAPARCLPVVGRQLHSASALSMAAETVTTAGIEALSEGQRLLAQPHRTGPERVELIRRLGALAARADRTLSPGSTWGPTRVLVRALARAHDQLADNLERLRHGLGQGSEAAWATVSLLAGPRRYLVFAANNAEMRAGSGMFLMLGVLTTAAGRLELTDMRSVIDVAVPPAAVPMEGDLAARGGC